VPTSKGARKGGRGREEGKGGKRGKGRDPPKAGSHPPIFKILKKYPGWQKMHARLLQTLVTICSLETSAFSALEVLDDNCAI